ncbi:TonB-dependent receptor plug domain-containing protein [Pseudomonas aeruginosa]|nr:TonB-dependent receptor plug domain-containing protein [Pseudomonas aeruginosa]MDF5923942.1 TonB-dependent receptor plug domain-containing protein [Pseudomonas aeruginosa]
MDPGRATLTAANAQPREALSHSDRFEQTRDEEAALALPADTVTGRSEDLSTEDSGSYATAKSRAGTGLTLTPRETPQSLSVTTRQRMDDQQLNSLRDVLENTTGVSSTMLDSERVSYSARGFGIDSFMYDGIPTTANAMAPGKACWTRRSTTASKWCVARPACCRASANPPPRSTWSASVR